MAAAPPETGHPALRIPVRADGAQNNAEAGPESPRAASDSRARGAAADPTPGVAPTHGYLPDPPALSRRGQWEYRITYDRGRIGVASASFRCLPQPARTARRLGRFALELWVGFELIERVRFDFPLLAAEGPAPGPRRPISEPPRFAPGAQTERQLRVPHSARATRAVVLDRATGETVDIPWPPSKSPAPTACEEASGAPTLPPGRAPG